MSLTVSLVLLRSCMSLTVSHCYWLSLTLSLSEKELLHVSQDLLCLLDVSNCLCVPMELLHVSHCLL